MPYFREHRRVVRVLVRKTVYLLAEPSVIVGLRFDKAIERIGDETVAYNYHAYAAHAAALPVGGLEIYGGEIGHGMATLHRFVRHLLGIQHEGAEALLLGGEV